MDADSGLPGRYTLAAPDTGSERGLHTVVGGTIYLKNPTSPQTSTNPGWLTAAICYHSVSLHSVAFMAPLCPQWESYPDVLAMQFNWDGYYKEVGSAFIGSSPEFEFALYSLCFIARPGKT